MLAVYREATGIIKVGESRHVTSVYVSFRWINLNIILSQLLCLFIALGGETNFSDKLALAMQLSNSLLTTHKDIVKFLTQYTWLLMRSVTLIDHLQKALP